MNCYLVYILYLSKAFWGARIGNCDIKPTDGTTIFAYLRIRDTSGSDNELNYERKMKNVIELMGFEPRPARWESRLLPTTPKGTVV